MDARQLSAARHARLFHPDARGDRVLPDGAQDQEAVVAARHRGGGAGAARGAAVRRARARAAARSAGALGGRVLGLRHPRGAAVQPAAGARARQGSAAVLLRGLRAAAVAVARARRTSSAPGPIRCSTATARRRRPRSAACAMRPASSRTSAGARIPTTGASRASTSSRTPASPASIIRAASSSPCRSISATSGQDDGRRRRAFRAAQGGREQAGAEAGAHHRRGRPHGAHAVDRHARRHRRDAARATRASKLVLTLPKAYAALDGERLRRRLAVLGRTARARARGPGRRPRLGGSAKVACRCFAIIPARSRLQSVFSSTATPSGLCDSMADDPYQILGVPRGASDEDIRRAYLKLVKELHPGRQPVADRRRALQEGDGGARHPGRSGSGGGSSTAARSTASGEPRRYAAREHAGAGRGGARGAAGRSSRTSATSSPTSSAGGRRGAERAARGFAPRGRDVRYTLEVDFIEARAGRQEARDACRTAACSTSPCRKA